MEGFFPYLPQLLSTLSPFALLRNIWNSLRPESGHQLCLPQSRNPASPTCRCKEALVKPDIPPPPREEGFPGGSGVKNPLPMQERQETWGPSLGQEDPLEKNVATHCSMPAWRIHGQRGRAGCKALGSQSLGVTEHSGTRGKG